LSFAALVVIASPASGTLEKAASVTSTIVARTKTKSGAVKVPLSSAKMRSRGEVNQIIALEKTKANRVESLRNWILEANHGEKLISQENFGEMKSFLQKVGLNRIFRDQTLTVSFIKPWDSLAETNVSVRSTADFSDEYPKWWRWRELNRPRPAKLSRWKTRT
jgi:hypothetical protein